MCFLGEKTHVVCVLSPTWPLAEGHSAPGQESGAHACSSRAAQLRRLCLLPTHSAIRRPHRDVTQKEKKIEKKRRGNDNCNPVTIRAVGGEANK